MANGVTPAGFSRKRLDEILADKNTGVRTVLGENLNLSPESPDGQINGVYSESDALLWELAEVCYNAFSPSKATNNTLSDLVEINGITRAPATASTTPLDITGLDGTIIPAGSLISANDGTSTFATDADVTIVGGVATVDSTATVTGPTEAVAGTLTIIDTPITGWSTVTNPANAEVGQNEETDTELRARRELSVTRAAKSIIDTILAEVLAVPNVEEAFIFENDTDVISPNTDTPPRSFQTVVLGGDNADIATAIYNEKPITMKTFGNTTENVTDSQGFLHPVNFTRPTVLEIYIIINLTVTSAYPPDGDDQIKQNIVDYDNGDLVVGRGFGVGDDVVHSELYTPINLVPGHSVDDLFIGFSASPTGEADLPIAFNEISSFVIANITVNS